MDQGAKFPLCSTILSWLPKLPTKCRFSVVATGPPPLNNQPIWIGTD